MQDLLAIGVAVVAGVWLALRLRRQLLGSACGSPPAGPGGSDGFVSLDSLTGSSRKQRSGRPEGRPDRV